MAIDLLSDALSMVRLTGALVFRVDVRGPWGVAQHALLENFAALLPPGTSHAIAFHVLLEGRCWVRRAHGDWLELAPGEVVVLAQGDAHDLADRPGRTLVPFGTVLGDRSPLDLRHLRIDTGQPPSTSLLCGALGCDGHAFEPLCESLPPLFHVKLGASMQAIVRYAATDALEQRPGIASLRVRLAELLFMESLRTWMEALPADATGWLAGLRDPLVGRALRALHADPCRAWTVDELALTIASSRSSLATRFRELIGEPPMHYLARLRMQLAARHLAQGRSSVERVAETVGYDSSAAFQRAFKRHFGVPPAAWRRTADASSPRRAPARL